MEMSISIPLDKDGFVRRECPACEREFKWLHTEGSGESPDEFSCPYCSVTAAPDQWFTKPQAAYISEAAARELIDPMLDDFERSVKRNNSPGSFVQIDVQRTRGPPPMALTEPNDMRIATPPCHPHEPIKVDSPPSSRLNCVICGAPFTG